MNACFCTGPRPGRTLCPCKERRESRKELEAFQRGIEIGQRMAQPRDVRRLTDVNYNGS